MTAAAADGASLRSRAPIRWADAHSWHEDRSLLHGELGMEHHSHFNCCIEVALPHHVHGPAYVFHYERGAVAPDMSDGELDETILRLLVQLADASGNLTLSVETILTKDELAALGSLPSDQIPTFALMHRRFDLIRQRFARHGLPASRITGQLL